VPRDHIYDVALYVLAGMLVGGFICNLLVRPLDARWFMKPDLVAALQAKAAGTTMATPTGSFGIGKGGLDAKAALFWAFVGIPLGWGVWITLKNALAIFQ
jgi:hypothetical protein